MTRIRRTGGVGFKYEVGDIYFRNIDKWLRDMFHSACVMRGSNMKKEFVRFMKEYVNTNTPKASISKAKTKRNRRKK